MRSVPFVQNVLVVGIPDERWGQKMAAVVEVVAGAEFNVEQFTRVCREYLSGYKMPRAVFLAEKIQRSPSGKAYYRWAKEYARMHLAVF